MKSNVNLKITIEDEDLLGLIKKIFYAITLSFLSLSIGIILKYTIIPKAEFYIDLLTIGFTTGMLWLYFKIKRKEKLNKQDECKHKRTYKIGQGKFKGAYKCLECEKILTEKEGKKNEVKIEE